MRAEKKLITKEYVARLNASPFFIVVDYTGLTVIHFNELRSRLRKSAAELHVVKNSVFRIAAQEAGGADLAGALAGQIAVITGPKDISAAAKALKNFSAEFEKPKLKFAHLGNKRLESAEVLALPSLAGSPAWQALGRPASACAKTRGHHQHAGLANRTRDQGEVRESGLRHFPLAVGWRGKQTTKQTE